MKLLFKSIILVVLIGTISSCRKNFEIDEFRDVPVINQIPMPLMSELHAVSGLPMAGYDLSTAFIDQEGDAFTVLNAESSNTNVATINFEQPIANFTETGIGTTKIIATIDDGNERDDPTSSFDLVISEPTHQFMIVFQEFENDEQATEVEGIGGTFTYVEGSPGSSFSVNNWILEYTTEEYAAFDIEFTEPLDLTNDATFSFEYANMWSKGGCVDFRDEDGGSLFIHFDSVDGLELNSSIFNTATVDLEGRNDGGINLKAVTGIWFEKWGATEESTFQLKNIMLGKL